MPRQQHRRLPLLNLSSSLCLLALSVCVCSAGAAEIHPKYVHNFGQVNDTLFRGASPSDDAVRELKDLGIGMIVDLRENGPEREHEKQLAEKLGLRYEHIPLARIEAPTRDEMQTILTMLMNEKSAKIFVHCMRGKDRTGTVIACYRIQHDGWDNLRALREARSYGMSELQQSMQRFIRRFTPFQLPLAENPQTAHFLASTPK